jgi:uncharacterized protein
VRRTAVAVLALFLTSALACGDDAAAPTPPPPVPQRDAGGDGSSAAARLRFASFNMHLFFDTVCDSGSCATSDFEQVRTEAQFNMQVQDRARGIARIDADVLALQEIETQAALDALTARLKADGFEYPVAHLAETGLPGSLDVAVLARGGTVDEVRLHRDKPITRPDGSETRFTRELLEVHLTYPAGKVVFFSAHFRSKAAGDDEGRRLAEATATRDIMLATAAELPDATVILGGDLNDVPGSPPLDALEEGGALVRILKDLPESSQTTFVFQGQGQAIDHIYAPPRTAERYVPDSALVVRDGAAGLAGSDHAAVRAEFRPE